MFRNSVPWADVNSSKTSSLVFYTLIWGSLLGEPQGTLPHEKAFAFEIVCFAQTRGGNSAHRAETRTTPEKVGSGAEMKFSAGHTNMLMMTQV